MSFSVSTRNRDVYPNVQPTGQQDIVNEEPQSDSQQETNFSPQADEDLSDTTISGESTANDEGTSESESTGSESEMSSN